MTDGKFAPREVFEQILKWAVIPTFDLVIEYDKQIILVKRKIAPYQHRWALPGLRILKGEHIDDVLNRIARQELGLKVEVSKSIFLGQYVGMFRTEHDRQDLSTGYYVLANPQQRITLNEKHLSSYKLIDSKEQIPSHIGAMYRFYLDKYFN